MTTIFKLIIITIALAVSATVFAQEGKKTKPAKAQSKHATTESSKGATKKTNIKNTPHSKSKPSGGISINENGLPKENKGSGSVTTTMPASEPAKK